MKRISLGTELSLVFAFIVAVTVFLVSILSGTFINRQFEEYVKKNQKEQADALAENIGSNFNEKKGGWNIDYVHGMGMYALRDGFIIRLYDTEGNMLWNAENHDMELCSEIMEDISFSMKNKRPDLAGEFVTYRYTLTKDQKNSGELEISYFTPFYFDENAFEFVKSLNLILMIAGAVSLSIAAFWGIVIARRIAEPIAGVIKVSGRISTGDYGTRVSAAQREVETYELAEAVNHMAAALEEQEYLRKEITRDIAHELRTPVSNIFSYIELMMDGVMEPSIERLKCCYDELTRLSSLLRDLDRLKNAEKAEISLNKKPVNLYALSERVLKGFENQLKEKHIHSAILGEKTIICIDEVRIGQVITNLLSNALKYTDENGEITLSIQKKKDVTELSVSDTGIGMSKEDEKRVFERFYRTDKSRARKTGGAGIGLSISRAFVEAHEGNIYCESQPGKGSRFVVELPDRK